MKKHTVTETDIQELIAEAVRLAKIEAFNLAIKIHADSFSRSSFRVALYNQIMALEGNKERA